MKILHFIFFLILLELTIQVSRRIQRFKHQFKGIQINKFEDCDSSEEDEELNNEIMIAGETPIPVIDPDPKTSRNLNRDFNYQLNGEDWTGICQQGDRQSPINILEGYNTVLDRRSKLSFEYELENSDESSKMTFNGYELYVDSEMGYMYFYNNGTEPDQKQAVEQYEATKIVFHYPAEHIVTVDGESHHYKLEMQIHHDLKKTSNTTYTHSPVFVQHAVVSIFFDDESDLPRGDEFLSNMGINQLLYQQNLQQFVILDKNETIGNKYQSYGFTPPGLDSKALDSLKELLNQDKDLYQYYGSDTQPPCQENTNWFIFKKPRSASRLQIAIMGQQIAKFRRPKLRSLLQETHLEQLHIDGNNRITQDWDHDLNGNIKYLKDGVKKIRINQNLKEVQ